MQINQANLTDLYRGYRTLFDASLQGSSPVSEQFLLEQPSSNKEEKYVWLGAVPGMRQLVDEVQIRNVTASNWTIANNEYEDTVAVKQFDIEADNYGIYNPLFASMGEAATYHKDELAFPLLLNGFSGTDYTGKNFFDKTKKRTPGDKGFTNCYVTGGSIAHPTLNVYSYRYARANLMSRVNATGRSMNLGRKLVLVCGAGLEPIAKNILVGDTALQAVTGTSTSNTGGVAAVTNVDKGTAQIVTSALIDASGTPNAWFLLECGLAVKPLVFQNNKAPVLTALTQPDSDHVFKKHEFLYQAYARRNAGYLMSDLAFGSLGSGSALTQYP